MIDMRAVQYDVELTIANGTRYLLNDALIDLQWEEQISELAQRATLSVANFKMEDTYLMSLCKIYSPIMIYGRWGGADSERTLLFDGKIWEWQYVSATRKEFSLTAYDQLIHLQQSKDFKYYSAGLTTEAIIGNICNDWGIPLAYKWEQSITHEKKIFNADKISDMIISLLEEVRQKTGENYVAHFRDGQLQITGRGTNTTVYRFDTENTISTTNKLTINNLVTCVKIIGKQDNEGRAPIDAIEKGDTKYGVLQEIVRRDGNKTLAAAKSEADTLLKDRGKPEETIQISVPDLPFMRKGDKIEVAAGNLIGFFLVEGVTHNATARTMTLSLEKYDQPPKAENTGGVFAKGDAVILNGPVYVDSYGNGKGKTFTDYHSTITIVAPLDRPCPYHIGAIGWVYPNEIKKG